MPCFARRRQSSMLGGDAPEQGHAWTVRPERASSSARSGPSAATGPPWTERAPRREDEHRPYVPFDWPPGKGTLAQRERQPGAALDPVPGSWITSRPLDRDLGGSGCSLGRNLGGADAVTRSIAGSRSGQRSPAPEACSSVQIVPSRWNTLARSATFGRPLPDGQIFDVITNRTSPLSGHRCLSPHVVGWAIVADVGNTRG